MFLNQGLTVIGGQNNVFLIQDPDTMQKALGGGGVSRKKLRNQGGPSDEQLNQRGPSTETISTPDLWS